MARYIDADELYKATQKRIAEANEARMAVVDDEFLDLINDAFTEDVAPRAEVAREILEEIMSEIQHRLLVVDGLSECSDDEEYYAGCSDAYGRIGGYILELKKKYADAEPPKGE